MIPLNSLKCLSFCSSPQPHSYLIYEVLKLAFLWGQWNGKGFEALGKSRETISSSPQLCSSLRPFLALFLGDFVSVGHSKQAQYSRKGQPETPTSLARLSRQPAPRLSKTIFTEPSILGRGGCSGSVLSLVLFIAHILWLPNELWPLICAKLQDKYLEGIRGSLSHPKGPSLSRRGHTVWLLFLLTYPR